MGKWRKMFQSSLPPVAERQYKTKYNFGPPATAKQIAAAEAALKIQFPAEVRELLSEFNGMWSKTVFDAVTPYEEIQFLDLKHMTTNVPKYFADCGNPLPPKKDLRKVVWVCQSNGFGELWGVCVKAVAGNAAGTVVHLDHEVGELKACRPSLSKFVRHGHAAPPPDPDEPPKLGEMAWKERVAAHPPRCLAGFNVTLVRRNAIELLTYLYLGAGHAVFTLACRCGGRHFKVQGRTRPDPATGKPTLGGPWAAECIACSTLTPIFDPAAHGAAGGKRRPAAGKRRAAGVPTVDTCCFCGAEPAEVFVGFEYPNALKEDDAFRGDNVDKVEEFVQLELQGRCTACKRLVGYAKLACGDAGKT